MSPSTPMPFNLQSELQRLPDKPGVYRMYSDSGELIYIGKAKILKNRVRSYFQKSTQHTPKVDAMISQIARFDYIVTDSEIEALILEANLVKQHKPKFNILLRDDKKYPWIGLSNEPFPRVFITRNPVSRRGRKGRKAKFFGPYTSSRDMYLLLEILKKHFPLRQRPKPLFKNRPCMNYFIGTCPGPCQNLISEEDYEKTVEQVELFLKGKVEDLLEILKHDMEQASETMNFELAAKLRDRYKAVENLLATQKVFYHDQSINQDIISAAGDELRCAFNVMSIRRGKLIASRSYDVTLTYQSSTEEAYSTFVSDYYANLDTDDLPDQILLQYPVEDEALLAEWLTRRRREAKEEAAQIRAKKRNAKKHGSSQHAEKVVKSIQFLRPEKGEKKDLLEMSRKNAKIAYEQAKLYDLSRLKNDPTRALIELQETLNLPNFPQRMECYDISHFQGGQTVASMVVFVNGVPEKAEYRRFKIKSAEGKPDDFKSMYEVIKRRFGRSGKIQQPTHPSDRSKSETSTLELISEDGQELPAVNAKSAWTDPDLVIIDGGKGQLGAAVSALSDLGVCEQPIISLAKKFEEVFLPGQSRPVLIRRDSHALFLLQQIRDEAHRFAITYHRALRAKAATHSVLDEIPGVGEEIKKRLLKHFGSLAQLEKASIHEIARVPLVSTKLAERIYRHLHPLNLTADSSLP